MRSFVADTVFKRDLFSETIVGHRGDDAAERLVFRNVSASPLWLRLVARLLAAREIRALKAAEGLQGVPRLLATGRAGHYRTWTDGTPLHFARPADAAFYRDAKRLLHGLHRRGITHNDLAKPQNWLVTPEGRAALIDFQLARVHRRRGFAFRLMAYEDLRHLLKQKRTYAPFLLTTAERRVLARKSVPARLWMTFAKPVYRFLTRGLFGWSDGEGVGTRMAGDAPSIVAALRAVPAIRDVALFAFAKPGRGTGLYIFVEAGAPTTEGALRAALAPIHVDCLQIVGAFPRRADGTARLDMLRLVALNQIGELDLHSSADAGLAASLRPIVANRLNFSDRQAPAT